ncbi:hypothetical protein [Sorangium sp. So ce131]|uniref:hypothetical protein n=1 Tax=Sorangium sp. So ce131 TaxID=3133282 RepID=UPI003F624C3A
MSRRNRALSLALASLALAPMAEARAGEGAPGVDLDWIAPGGCSDRGRVLAEIEQRLGRSVAEGGGAPRLRARAEVSRNERGSWDLHLTTTLGETTRSRELHGESCAELADAAALIIAFALDPDAAARDPAALDPALTVGAEPGAGSGAEPGAGSGAEPGAGLGAEPGAGSGAEPGAGSGGAPDTAAEPDARTAADQPVVAPPPEGGEPPAASQIEARPSPHLELRGALRASGVLDASSLPAVAPGVGISASALIGSVRAEVSGLYLGAQQALIAPTLGGDVWLLAGGLRLCSALHRKAFELGPCAGLEAGAMGATGFGVASPGSNRALWIAPQLGALATYALSDQIRAHLSVDALFPVTRGRFVLVGIGPVHRIPAATARASLGVEVQFP